MKHASSLDRYRTLATSTDNDTQRPVIRIRLESSEFSARNIVLDLNYHESTALVDAHARRCKLRTEAESARAETVAQRASFVDLEESKSRLIPELEELITCSYQSGTKFDQASLQVESCRETGRSVLVKGGALFQRVPLQITSRTASESCEK